MDGKVPQTVTGIILYDDGSECAKQVSAWLTGLKEQQKQKHLRPDLKLSISKSPSGISRPFVLEGISGAVVSEEWQASLGNTVSYYFDFEVWNTVNLCQRLQGIKPVS